MDLHFLCPYHEHLVLRDRPRAEGLWHGLVAQGKTELAQKQWARAASFFGSAAEIALLRASVEQDQQQVDSLDKLLYASKFLIDSFCHIGDLESASTYIDQLSANGQNLFLRQPWSKSSSLNDTEVQRGFDDAIQKCYEAIKFAENGYALQELTQSKLVARPSNEFLMSKAYMPKKQFGQKQNLSSSVSNSKYDDPNEWRIAMAHQVH